MKPRLLTLAIFSIALSAFADVITPEEALARVFSSQHQPMSTIGNTIPKLVKTETANNQPTLYIYSTQGNEYMILSADDQAEAMLAYGSNFTGEINPSMQWLLGEYSKEIESMRNNPQARCIPLSTASTPKAAISPMITTKWNQGYPFNLLCPEENGQTCVTGCVATAMAQIINYYQIPSGNGTGTASYEWNGQTLTFDFANNSFDWENMIDVYDSNATDAQMQAVAKLMSACGISVSMMYGANASGAYSVDVPNALIEYFGFDKGAHIEQRIYYTAQEWNDYIYSQLTENGPVYLSGSNDSAGHAFVCDGYSSDNFFHINWGWGGSSDGYFKLSALDPSNQGIGGSMGGYSAGLSVVADVKAPVAGSSYFQCMSIYEPISVSAESATLGGSVSVSGFFYNSGATTLSCDLGFIIENISTGEYTYSLTGSVQNVHVNYGLERYNFIIPDDLSEGNYKVYPAWRISGENWAKIRGNTNYAVHIDMTVSGNNAYFSVSEGALIEMQDEQLTTPIFIGKEVTFTGTLYNTSSTEYYGPVFAALLSLDGNTAIARGKSLNVELESGTNKDITYSSIFYVYENQSLTAGEYILVFADQEGRIISSGITVEVQNVPAEAGSLYVSSIEFVGDKNNADRNNLEFNATINCTSGYFIGNANLWIFELAGDYYQSLDYIASPTLYINSGETIVQTYKASMPSLKIGTEYVAVMFQDNSTQISNLYPFTIGEVSAIEDIAIDNEVETRQYYTISGVEVTEDNLKPGLYIVIERMKDGQVITSKQMINQ